MKKIVEGYYCQDVDKLKAISTENKIRILNTFEDAHPQSLTKQEIRERTKMDGNTIDNITNSLAKNGFLKKLEKRVRPGKPSQDGASGRHSDSVRAMKPAWTYLFENLSFSLNKANNFDFPFAPGSIQYNKEFLDVYDLLVNWEDQDRIHTLLLHFLKEIFIKVEKSHDALVTRTRPETKERFICPCCGINHKARDFIRAILLYLLDQLETDKKYVNFLREGKLANEMACCQLQAAREEKLQSRDRARREDLILRVLSIKKKNNQILILALNKDRKLVYGCIDSKEIIDGITADTMVKCRPGVLDSNRDGTFSMLVFEDDYIRAIVDEPSFPTFNSVKINLGEIKKKQDLPRITQTCFVDAFITQIPLPNESSIEHIDRNVDLIIGDGTGQVRLTGKYDNPEELKEGDKIKVVGACAIPDYNVYMDSDHCYDYVIEDVELRLGPYGSIIKIPKYTPSTKGVHLTNHQ